MKIDPAWKEEEKRQSQELSDLIQDVINDYGIRLKSEGRMPTMNALAGALVAVQGSMLAAIEDPRHRKALRQVMERTLPRAIAEMLGKAGNAEVIVLGGVRQ
jgi:hypothetical protein